MSSKLVPFFACKLIHCPVCFSTYLLTTGHLLIYCRNGSKVLFLVYQSSFRMTGFNKRWFRSVVKDDYDDNQSSLFSVNKHRATPRVNYRNKNITILDINHSPGTSLPIHPIILSHTLQSVWQQPLSNTFHTHPLKISRRWTLRCNTCVSIYFISALKHCAIFSLIIPCPVKYRCNPLTNSICSSGDRATTAVCIKDPTVTCLTAMKLW